MPLGTILGLDNDKVVCEPVMRWPWGIRNVTSREIYHFFVSIDTILIAVKAVVKF